MSSQSIMVNDRDSRGGGQQSRSRQESGFAVLLGLVLRQDSTGDNHKLLIISKRGN